MWRDWKKSALCFGSSTAIFLVLTLYIEGSPLGLAAQGLAVLVAAAYLWSLAGGLLKLYVCYVAFPLEHHLRQLAQILLAGRDPPCPSS